MRLKLYEMKEILSLPYNRNHKNTFEMTSFFGQVSRYNYLVKRHVIGGILISFQKYCTKQKLRNRKIDSLKLGLN